jgi:peptide-methionine (S)-S-oxide reductase
VLAGGCFWGVQGVFQRVKGVTSAVSGYTGGSKKDAQYEIVSGGGTGHAESVQYRSTIFPLNDEQARIAKVGVRQQVRGSADRPESWSGSACAHLAGPRQWRHAARSSTGRPERAHARRVQYALTRPA